MGGERKREQVKMGSDSVVERVSLDVVVRILFKHPFETSSLRGTRTEHKYQGYMKTVKYISILYITFLFLFLVAIFLNVSY